MNDTTTRRHRNENDSVQGKLFKFRNILNMIFMIGAIVGVVLYLALSHTVGTIVILVAMSFKIVECSLRFLH